MIYPHILSFRALVVTVVASCAVYAAPPELDALQQQYEKSLDAHVVSVYAIALGQLNVRYLDAVERGINTARAAGNLAEVLALEEEKKLITGGGPVPDGDDTQTQPNLKKLRTVYREQRLKLNTQKAANHAVVVKPHLAALKQLEVTLTKANRVADAKEVMDYRTTLEGSAASSSPSIFPQASFTNSLGMKFVPVKGTQVMFCIHETRRKDFAQYADTTPVANNTWKGNELLRTQLEDPDNQPAYGIAFEDAVAFCVWLSKKEGKTYRLPTDKEWSYAAGIGHKEKWTKGTTPEMRSDQKAGDYPWGKNFPPKSADRVGNYADTAWHEKSPGDPYISDYTDGFPATSPVMSFNANDQGLYDIGGNVAEWVSDWLNTEKTTNTLRGGSWISGTKDEVMSSKRGALSGGVGYYNSFGFRVVLEQP